MPAIKRKTPQTAARDAAKPTTETAPGESAKGGAPMPKNLLKNANPA